MNQRPNPPQNRPQRPIQNGQPPRRSAPPPKPPQRHDDGSNKRFYIVAAVSAILVLVLSIGMISSAIKYASGGDKPQPQPEGPSTPSAGSNGTVLEKGDDMGLAYQDDIIFVGDSNTAHMRSFEVLTGGKDTKQVWVPESQTLTLDSEITNKKIIYPETGEQMTIAEAAGLAKPKYMVITLGTNGINYLNQEQFKYCYEKLINAIKEASPRTKIILQSIFPVTDWYDKISNAKINEANSWIIEVASNTGARYLDSASVLKDKNGALIEDYNSYHGDGYHINREAYEAILDYIRTHPYK